MGQGDERVECIALHVVHADRQYHPGERLSLDRDDCAALIAAGAVEPVDETLAGESPRPVTLVKGVGPKTAAKLAELGVETLEDLATMEGSVGERIVAALELKPDILPRWRDEARALVDAESDGD